jgi:hypothetical protein
MKALTQEQISAARANITFAMTVLDRIADSVGKCDRELKLEIQRVKDTYLQHALTLLHLPEDAG